MMDEFIIDSENREMFEVFCRLHPLEAYDLNTEAFLEFMYREYPTLTRDKIESLIEEIRTQKDK